jgi:hypothetical protein
MQGKVNAAGEETGRAAVAGASRQMARVLACILLAATAREMPAQRNEPPVRRYSNPGFEYGVRLPRGLAIERSRPPNPDSVDAFF